MADMPAEVLRRRHAVAVEDVSEKSAAVEHDPKSQKEEEEVVWGKTPSGEGECVCPRGPGLFCADIVPSAIFPVFRVPTTHDVVTALLHPAYPKSHLDILNLGLLGLQLLLFAQLPHTARKIFFFLYFAFWRAAYDAGLGYVLTKQSKKRWIVKEVQRLGWLDAKRKPEIRNWIKKQLIGKMGKDYSFDVCCFFVYQIPELNVVFRSCL